MKFSITILFAFFLTAAIYAQAPENYPYINRMSAGPLHNNLDTGMGEFYRIIVTNKGTGETGEVHILAEYLIYDRDLLNYKVYDSYEIPASFLDTYIESGTIDIRDWIAWDEVKINFLQECMTLKLGKSLYEVKKTKCKDDEDYVKLHSKDNGIYNYIESMSMGPIEWSGASENGERYRLMVVRQEIYSSLYVEHIFLKGPEALDSELAGMFRIPMEKVETTPFQEEGGDIRIRSWISWNEVVVEYDYGCVKLTLGPKLEDIKSVPCE